ncbi:hypothetical protein BDN72DRAFT_366563 [Pluteus cervinus]|uniref:Uncharacterized protein n=1 Tax=Pluteus cervinus TaxID=181527 RepID=A0ACD3BED8_9AGAR|nr:hypothetical protein BDN72DRAFT_366563 [Pluteus cervinus]
MAAQVAPQPRALQAQTHRMTPHLSLPKKDHPPPAKPSVNPTKSLPQSLPQKKVPRRSSKPIINWFQRKLAGAKRTDDHRPQPPTTEVARGKARNATLPGRLTNPTASVPAARHSSVAKLDSTLRRKTVSLNGDDDLGDFGVPVEQRDDISTDGSWLARVSTWSPSSALEADEDASMRPLPPSVPPSPSPSRSSSSYLSDSHTFNSIAASTKPTTLLSIDLGGNGMAHIAQAPLTPTTQFGRMIAHGRTSSTATNTNSLSFAVFPQTVSRPPSAGLLNANSQGHLTVVQAPLHTAHHPRNNPRPSSPPLDNASVLTLASSAFGFSGSRGGHLPDTSSIAPSALGDSISHFDGGSVRFADSESTAQFGDEERLEYGEVDASVRALRAQSSRRNSWESVGSRWSARVQDGPSTPSLARRRSTWTTHSITTGAPSGENGDEGNEKRSQYEEARSELRDENVSTTSVVDEAQNSKNALSITEPHEDERKQSIDTVAGVVIDNDNHPTTKAETKSAP